MNRNQVIVISACVVLLAGLYLFGKTTKPKDDTVPANMKEQMSGHATPAAVEELNIEEYVSGVNAAITDKAIREKVEKLTAAKDYNQLIKEYQKLDKPLAVAYCAVKLANSSGKAADYVKAGDYSAMLSQSAPDEKARKYLNSNIIECYRRAVELDSTNTDSRIRLAGAYMEDGTQPMQGVMLLLDIVKKDSNNVDAQLMLGRFGLISGQIDKAIARLEKVLYLQPENSEALFLLAEAYNKQGNTEKAIQLLEKCKKALKDPKARKEIDDYIQNIKKPKS